MALSRLRAGQDDVEPPVLVKYRLTLHPSLDGSCDVVGDLTPLVSEQLLISRPPSAACRGDQLNDHSGGAVGHLSGNVSGSSIVFAVEWTATVGVAATGLQHNKTVGFGQFAASIGGAQPGIEVGDTVTHRPPARAATATTPATAAGEEIVVVVARRAAGAAVAVGKTTELQFLVEPAATDGAASGAGRRLVPASELVAGPCEAVMNGGGEMSIWTTPAPPQPHDFHACKLPPTAEELAAVAAADGGVRARPRVALLDLLSELRGPQPDEPARPKVKMKLGARVLAPGHMKAKAEAKAMAVEVKADAKADAKVNAVVVEVEAKAAEPESAVPEPPLVEPAALEPEPEPEPELPSRSITIVTTGTRP